MSGPPHPTKPKALRPGSRISPIAPASPASEDRLAAGRRELERLGFTVVPQPPMRSEGYFAGSTDERRAEFVAALSDSSTDALVATRGGYGSAYLLDGMPDALSHIKPIIGFSDLTTLQVYLWQKHRWPTFYGPMVAAGFDAGDGVAHGFDLGSFQDALINIAPGYVINAYGEPIVAGSAEGILLGGALTLLEASIGTPWELDTTNAILVLEDRAMKPYQIDRVLLHLKHAGKFKNVRGIILGDFPDCSAPVPGSPTVLDVARRILTPLGVPIVFGAPVGHTTRPMLTLPLGAPARLIAEGSGTLNILETTVTP